ncbi:hypothetical protein Y1Q_0013629 [Alligator mississippiensis]|uniref:Uncharacterized protein n=1 Tax=Alligator mississippiensis TaxID=8496 RepID=A0A151P4D6_ALLMI|nr:hypothetical protein Y1Q_0013629 [Alligator mississippiensis]
MHSDSRLRTRQLMRRTQKSNVEQENLRDSAAVEAAHDKNIQLDKMHGKNHHELPQDTMSRQWTADVFTS